jgi:copper chaperone NosL
MTNVRWGLVLVACAALLATVASACRSGAAEIAPPEIRYGEDVCADCNMIISDPRYASAYLYEVGDGRHASLAFDDIGDMVRHAAAHPEHAIAAWYVHDYTSEAWIDATTANYVYSADLQTPMAWGMAAHGTASAAEKMAAEVGGEVLDWAAASERLAEPRP